MIRVAIIVLFLCLTSCTKTVYVPVERTRTVTVTEHDTVVNVKLEKEVIRVKTRDTIAHAETRYAFASARWNAEREQLALNLENKQVSIPVETKYIELVRVDSIPFPVEVPVPVRYVAWYDKVLHWLFGAFGIYIVLRLLLKRFV